MQCTVKNFKKLAESIQERVFLHMWTLEGVTDINLEKQLEQKKKQISTKEAIFVPIGIQVSELKKKVQKRTGESKLMICPPEELAPNNLSHFGFGSRARSASSTNRS